MAVFIDTMKEQKKGMGLLNLTDVQIFLILFLELTNLIDSNTYFRVYLCLFIQCSLMRVLWLRSCFGLVLLRSVFRLPRTQVKGIGAVTMWQAPKVYHVTESLPSASRLCLCFGLIAFAASEYFRKLFLSIFLLSLCISFFLLSNLPLSLLDVHNAIMKSDFHY